MEMGSIYKSHLAAPSLGFFAIVVRAKDLK